MYIIQSHFGANSLRRKYNGKEKSYKGKEKEIMEAQMKPNYIQSDYGNGDEEEEYEEAPPEDE